MLSLIRNNFIFYAVFLPVFIGCSFVFAPASLVVGGMGAIWFLVKKRYDYIVLIFLMTLILANNRSPIFGGYRQLRVVFIGVLFFLSGLVIYKQKGLDRRVIYFLPFFFVGLISSFLFSPLMVTSVFEVLSYLTLVVSIFVLVIYLLENTLFELYEHLLIILSITLFISLLGGFIYPSVFKLAGRLRGVLGNPNFFGLFCVIAYIFVDHFSTKDSTITKPTILLLKALIIICLFLTGSRNSYMAVAIYIGLSVLLFRGISGKTLALAVGCGVLVVFFNLGALVKAFPFLAKLIRPDTLQSASGRSLVWPVAIDKIYSQPWLGSGFSFGSYYIAQFAKNHGLVGVYWHGVWNTYLAILLDTGVIGLCAYFYFIYGVIRKSARFVIIIPFLAAMIFTGIFEAWAVSSLNPITPFFLLFFVLISFYGSKYENIGVT